MPATTMGANENFLSYMSTLSLSLSLFLFLSETRGEKKRKGGRGRESMCENEREIHTWLREK